MTKCVIAQGMHFLIGRLAPGLLCGSSKVKGSAGGSGIWIGDIPTPPWMCRDVPPAAAGPMQPTCMPQMRTPRQAEVLCAHFLMWRAFFSSDASSPCCRVPIFRSRTQGCVYCDTTFSSNKNPSHTTLRKALRTSELLFRHRPFACLRSCLEMPYSGHHSSLPLPSLQTSSSLLLRIQSISFAGCFNKSIYLGGVYEYVSFFSFSILL